jgi:hypothetical protein
MSPQVQVLLSNIFKFVLLALAIFYGYLYFTRPELEIADQKFIDLAKKNGFKVYQKSVNKAEYNSNDKYYYAVKGWSKIYFLHFEDENDCKRYFSNLLNQIDNKYSLKVSKDVRIGDIPSEMQSYVYEDTYYAVIRTRHVVIHGNTFYADKPDVNYIFEYLYKVPTVDFQKIAPVAAIEQVK